MVDTVRYEAIDGLATITLNRPDAMNALDTATKIALRDAVTSAARDSTVRVVLLASTGRAFCVGQDLKEHVDLLAEDPSVPWHTVADHYNPVITAIATMPKPVVAAVNGVAAGAGASLAFACDFRLVADTAAFNTAFASVGLTADSGMSWTLPRLVGQTKAAQLLMFPTIIGAEEARNLGLATRVVSTAELADEALALARTLAVGPTLAYAAIKESLAYSADHSLEQTLAREAELQTKVGMSADHAAAVRAFLTKTQPRYEGR